MEILLIKYMFVLIKFQNRLLKSFLSEEIQFIFGGPFKI